MFGIQHITSK